MKKPKKGKRVKAKATMTWKQLCLLMQVASYEAEIAKLRKQWEVLERIGTQAIPSKRRRVKK